jgi:hypothetical protein
MDATAPMSTIESITLLGLLLALGAAIVNWNYARIANRHAAQALDLAKAADQRADRLENIARERRDVFWSANWNEDMKALTVRNVGTDTAYDVELVVDAGVTDERYIARLDTVGPTELIARDLTEAHDKADSDWNASLNSGYIGLPDMGVTARITWRSESGVPGIESFDDLNL